MRCAAGHLPGLAFASTFSTYRRRFGRARSRSTPMTNPTRLRGRRPSERRRRSPENPRELERRRDLELVVAAVRWWFVRPPAQKDSGVSEAVALQMIVFDLA